MSIEQLSTVLGKLKIQYFGYDDPTLNIGKFFKSLELGDDYCRDKFQLIGIMLSKGWPQEKAEAIFDHFDLDGSGHIDQSSFHKIFE